MSQIQGRLNASSCSGCSEEAHSCSFCSTLRPTIPFNYSITSQSKISAKSVNEALRNGCLFAKLLWKEAQPETFRIPGVSTECCYDFMLKCILKPYPQRIDISYWKIYHWAENVEFTHYAPETSLSFYLSTSSGSPLASDISTRPICRSTTQEKIQYIQSWLKGCQYDSPQLSNRLLETLSGSTSFTPARLLRIQKTSISYAVCLIETNNENLEYFTLSYCWGGDQTHKLTAENLAQYHRAIDFAILPQTIQDSITVTSGLGFTYLWVDSLCIIQDDDVDKAQQIALMPEIYSGAFMTIAACSAESASEGFLDRCTHYPTVRFRMRAAIGEYHFVNGLVVENFGNNWLSTRGWCVQEEVLSPRKLEFHHRQIVLTCNCSHHSLHDDRDGWSLFKEKFTYQSLPTMKSKTLDEFAHTWCDVVNEYTARELTNPNDRVLAISGIAKYLSRLENNDTYVAGLWMTQFPWNLLWRRSSDDSRINSVTSYFQPPSWSWVSILGTVVYSPSFMYMPAPSALILLDTYVELKEESAPFGAVNCARLKVRGRIRAEKFDTDTLDGSLPVSYRSKRFHVTVKFDHPGLDMIDGHTFFLLDVFSVDEKFKTRYGEPPEGLILKEIAPREHVRCFMRVGIFQYTDDTERPLPGVVETIYLE